MLWKLEKLIRLNRHVFTRSLAWNISVFLLIHLITGIVLYFFKEKSSILISGMVLPCVNGVFLLVTAAVHIQTTYVQAVRCGETRRMSLLLTLALLFAEMIWMTSIAALLTTLEHAVAPGSWQKLAGMDAVYMDQLPPVPDMPAGMTSPDAAVRGLFVETFTFDGRVCLLIAAAAVLLGIAWGTAYLRFGIWAAKVIPFVCTGTMLIVNILPWKTQMIAARSWPTLILLGAVVLFMSFRYLLHAAVR